MQTFEIQFSAEEVNLRTDIVGNPAVITLLKRSSLIPDGKLQYSTLLCEKISQAIPAHSKFSAQYTLVAVSGGLTRVYLKCGHGVSHPVTYPTISLQRDHPLNFKIIVKCLLCLGIAPVAALVTPIAAPAIAPVVAPVVEPAIAPVVAPVVAPIAALLPEVPVVHRIIPPIIIPIQDNPTVEVFQDALNRFAEVMNRAAIFCGSKDNPMNTFNNNSTRIGHSINLVWNKVAREALGDEVVNFEVVRREKEHDKVTDSEEESDSEEEERLAALEKSKKNEIQKNKRIAEQKRNMEIKKARMDDNTGRTTRFRNKQP